MKSRKELKAEYKENIPKMGVFQIRNTQNNKVLIDQSVDVQAKWNRHNTELKFGSHRNKNLQQDWDVLGASCFVFEMVSELAHDDDLDLKNELKQLHDLVLDEMNIQDEMRY